MGCFMIQEMFRKRSLFKKTLKPSSHSLIELIFHMMFRDSSI